MLLPLALIARAERNRQGGVPRARRPSCRPLCRSPYPLRTGL